MYFISKFWKYTTLIVLAGLMACNQQKGRQKLVKSTDFKTIRINIASANSDMGFSDLLKVKRIIPLKANGYFTYNNVEKIDYYDNLLFVFDNSGNILSVFNENGEFMYNIGTMGPGPLKNSDVSDFTIDKTEKRILLLSVENKSIYEYNFEGKYVSTIKLPFQAQLMSISENDSLLSFYLGYVGSNHNNFIVTNRQVDKVVFSGFPYPPDVQAMDLSSFTGNLSTNGNGFLYSDATSSTIEQVLLDGRTFTKYKVLFNETDLAPTGKYEFWKFYEKLSLNEVNYLSTNYHENSKYLVFSYGKAKTRDTDSINNEYNAIYDKELGKLYLSDNDNPNFLDLTLSGPLGISNNTDFVSIIDPTNYKFKKFFNTLNDKDVSYNIELNNAIKNNGGWYNYVVVLYDFKKSEY